MNISKQQVDFLKGIALLLMLTLHLFNFSDRIHPSSQVVFLFQFQNINIERYIAYFGGICVPMFFFLSGYGFSVSGIKQANYYRTKILSTYKAYWWVFFLFVPVGLIFFGDQPRYNFNALNFIQNLFALNSSYNPEWWFIQPYLLLVALTPIFNRSKKRPTNLLLFSIVCFSISFIMKWFDFDTPGFSLFNLLYWQPAYIMGYVIGSYKQNPKIKTFFSYIDKYKITFTISSIILCLSLVFTLKGPGRILATPFFIYLCLRLYELSPRHIIRIFQAIGTYSMGMWLTHSFYCYYYFQDIVYMPRYSVFILTNLMVISFITSYGIETIKKWFNQIITSPNNIKLSSYSR